MSIEAEQYLRLKNKIYSDLNVKTFSIHNWHKLTEIPIEIGLLQKLEQLSIHQNSSIKIYPKELADLPNLKLISLRLNNLKQIPPVLGQVLTLNNLILSQNRFSSSAQWHLLAQLPHLTKLDLSYSLQNMDSVPLALCMANSLVELNLSGNNLKTLPKEFAQLQNLERLNCEKNSFETFPSVLAHLPKLQQLQLPAKSIEQLPDEILCLQHIPSLLFTAKSNSKTPYVYEFERLLKNIKIYSFDNDFQLFFLRILRHKQTISTLDNKNLFRLLNCASSDYMNQALNEIEHRITQGLFGPFQYPKAGDKVVIKGKINGKVSELKARLLQNNIQTGVKLNHKTTHILIAKMPGSMIDIPLDKSVCIMTEQLLVSYLNEIEQPYLLTESQDHHVEQIRSLLHNDSTENVLMALEILKGGGLPMELVTDLFLVYKFSKTQKIKRIIIQLIGQNTSLSFVTAIKNRKAIGRYLSETTRRQNLEFYCQTGNLNKIQISLYLLKKGINTHSFALLNFSSEDKISYFSQNIEDGFLSLSSLELSELPEDIALIPGLKHLDLSHNRFTSIPPALFQCKELESLYIRGLYEIQEKPDDLWKIDSLQTIYIGYHNKWLGKANWSSKKMTVNGKKVIM